MSDQVEILDALPGVDLGALTKLRPFINKNGKTYITDMETHTIQEVPAVITMTKEEWIGAELTAMESFRAACPITWELVSRGLTHKLPEQALERSDVRTLAGTTIRSLPLPLTIVNFHYKERHYASDFGKLIGQETDRLLLGDRQYPGLQGIRTHPNTLRCNGDVGNAISMLTKQRHYGPYAIICNHDIAPDVGEFESITEIIESPLVPLDSVIVLQMTADSIRIVQGVPPTIIKPNDTSYFMLLCCIVPHLRNLGAVICKGTHKRKNGAT